MARRVSALLVMAWLLAAWGASAQEGRPVLTSLQAERTVVEPGGRMSPECTTWLLARVWPESAGVEVAFSIKEGTGTGLLAPACVSAASARTSADGTVWVALISSDAEEPCVVSASAGGVTFSTSVRFKADSEESVLVFLPASRGEEEEPSVEVDAAEAARLAALAGELSDEDAAVRTRAKSDLVAAGRRAVPVLTRIIYDPSKPRHVRGIAATGLGEIRDDMALRGLARALGDPRSYVREGAVRGLAAHPGERPRQVILKALASEKAYVRSSALAASAATGMGEAEGDLAAAASDPDPSVRATAAWLLKGASSDAGRKALDQMLSDPEPFVRYIAAKAMMLSRGDPVPGGLGPAAADAFAGTRCAAVRAMGLRGGAGAVEALGRAASDSDVRVVRNAAVALSDRASDPAARAILRRLAESQDRYAARVAALAVASCGGEEDVGAISRMLAAGDEELVAAAVSALRRLALRDVAYPVQGTPEQKARAVDYWRKWCERSGGDGRRKWLADALADRSSALRGEAALELAKLGVRSVAADAERLLRDRLWQNRHGAALALSALGDARGTSYVAADLGDRNWYVRAKAVETLGRLADARAVEELILHGLDDPSEQIREQALEAIRKVAGEAVAFDPVAEPVERQRAIARLSAWWESQRRKAPGTGTEGR